MQSKEFNDFCKSSVSIVNVCQYSVIAEQADMEKSFFKKIVGYMDSKMLKKIVEYSKFE